MRRQAALGLVDRVLVDRFRLWSIWMGALTVQFGFILAIRIAGRLTGHGLESWPTVIPIVRGGMAVTMLVAMLALTLTFSPPRVYQRWLARA